MNIEDFYRERRREYLNKARGILRDYAYAEDCIQETFEMCLRYYSEEKVKDFEPWFNTVFYNTIRKYQRIIIEKGIVFEEGANLVDVKVLEYVDITSGVVEREINSWAKSPRARNTLHLYLLSGHSGEDVAALTGQSQAAVRKQMQRFKQHLTQKYGK